MPHQGLEPALVLCLAFQSDALPTELSLTQMFVVKKLFWIKCTQSVVCLLGDISLGF